MPLINIDTSNLGEFAEFLLLWIGFGTVVGLIAKAIMPGNDPGGSIATLVIGIIGTLIGCGLLKFFEPSSNIKPVSQLGFVVGVTGAFVLLMCYRLLGGYYFVEGEGSNTRARRRRRVRHYVPRD